MKSEEKTTVRGLLRAVFRESTTKRLFEQKYPDMYKHLSNVVEESKIQKSMFMGLIKVGNEKNHVC